MGCVRGPRVLGWCLPPGNLLVVRPGLLAAVIAAVKVSSSQSSSMDCVTRVDVDGFVDPGRSDEAHAIPSLNS